MTPHPASSAILIRDGRMLLVKRMNAPARDMYAFPGGRAEPGESPEETAIREMAEETGIIVSDPRPFMTFDLGDDEGAPHFRLSVFIVSAPDGGDGLAADDAAALGWFSAEEVEALEAPDSVRICIRALVEQGHLS